MITCPLSDKLEQKSSCLSNSSTYYYNLPCEGFFCQNMAGHICEKSKFWNLFDFVEHFVVTKFLIFNLFIEEEFFFLNWIQLHMTQAQERAKPWDYFFAKDTSGFNPIKKILSNKDNICHKLLIRSIQL